MIYLLKLLMVKDKEFYSFIRKQLHIRPRQVRLYELAFLHRSASVILPDGSTVNNERLEYLGDAVIDAVVADYLFRRFPKEREGFLTQMRSKIVNRAHLYLIASEMGLMKMLVTNRELPKRRICGDVFEALIGAMYLDRGYKKTQHYLIRQVLNRYVDLEQLIHTETDFKSRLIEWGQKYRLQVGFETVEKYSETAGNAPVFVVSATISGVPVGKGSGTSKKEASQQASQQALTYISTSTDFATDALSQYLDRIKKR